MNSISNPLYYISFSLSGPIQRKDVIGRRANTHIILGTLENLILREREIQHYKLGKRRKEGRERKSLREGESLREWKDREVLKKRRRLRLGLRERE